ncbi:hypothetical protein [Azospirillum brasilense]|uniref:hypothetical protein n=1 Tax=Azospirillum brasilense TaxID=192 RepID=UPI00039E88DA|nr:hypothetical protein [Azospirillum brasilense]
MALPPLTRRNSDLPLAKDPTSRFLMWLTALMVYLAALALAGALLVSDMTRRWDSGLAGGLTVQVMPPTAPRPPRWRSGRRRR